jgi:DNA-binding CsgD family transcriptional regulator
MTPALYVRALTPEERPRLEAGLRSSEAFTLRRCPSLLASARGQRPATIARQLGGAPHSVRNAMHAFDSHGLDSLHARSRRPQRTRLVSDAAKREQLRAPWHQSPRPFGEPRSTRTLALAAEVCREQELTPYHVSIENSRQAFKRVGVRWQRAKSWVASPDPH